ncbi:ribonuclease P protein component [Sphingobacterium sp. UT-1RO-CII-1]|uniref:ribonuclease P protein component n=1 Tax=Sphingobacterium sp. UT-1RO-CII-1 TaxID=2995225 RepID=UPI00227A8733|nr:ribonuclease P protein component [Sphingobacterium sp. UT-1RO-CII-1]MCY4780073.1 ribonuclease P protein component [Sphingobacterium sp. UT-1RO-CII-1]
MRNTFTKEERLCSKRLIDSLFNQGSSFVVYPYRVVFCKRPLMDAEMLYPVQCIISVSKRRFKKAVDRNKIKRLMRESYRLNKSGFHQFLRQNSLELLVAFQYVGKEELPFEKMCVRMETVLERLEYESIKAFMG